LFRRAVPASAGTHAVRKRNDIEAAAWVWYGTRVISSRDIRQYVGALVRTFNPERVVLFGSYAEGHPTEDSDVDILAVIEGRRDGSAGCSEKGS